MTTEKPTIEKCLEVIKQLNEGIPQSEKELKNKANWLYLLNRLSFFHDIPILLEIIYYEREWAVDLYCSKNEKTEE